MKLGIFLPNWLGDLVMATPTLRSLRRHFGAEAKMIGIVRPHLADVLRGTPWLDEQWPFNPHGQGPHSRHFPLLGRMRRERLDMVVMLTNSPRPAILTYLAGVKSRVGYARAGRGPLLTSKVYRPRTNGRPVDLPMVDYYLQLAEVVGCPPESRCLELATLDQDERAADRVWDSLGLRDDGRVIALNSSGAYGASKLWPDGHFAELARRIVQRLDHDVLVMCGPNERGIAENIVRRANHPRVVCMANQPLDLGVAKACVRRSRLMISTDSGPRHMAAAFGLPVVTVYGPILPIWSANPTVHGADLHLDLDCIGCHKRLCPLEHNRCMRDLSVDSVFREIVSLIEQDGPTERRLVA